MSDTTGNSILKSSSVDDDDNNVTLRPSVNSSSSGIGAANIGSPIRANSNNNNRFSSLGLDMNAINNNSNNNSKRPPLPPSLLEIPMISSPSASPATLPNPSPTFGSGTSSNGSRSNSFSNPTSPTSILQKEKSPSLKRVSISEYTIEIPPESNIAATPGSLSRRPSNNQDGSPAKGQTEANMPDDNLRNSFHDALPIEISMMSERDSISTSDDGRVVGAGLGGDKLPASRSASFTSNCSNLRSSAATNNDEDDYENYDLDDINFEDTSNCCSFFTLSFLNGIFQTGNNKGSLTLQDLGGISIQDRCELLYQRFMGEYQKEIAVPQVTRRSLWKAIWRTIGPRKLVRAIVLAAFAAALQFGPINILTRLVRHFQGLDHYTENELWIMVAFLFICPFLASIASAHSNVIMAHIGAGSRNVLINAIYRKSLKISSFARQKLSTGHIITMFSDDTNQIRNYISQQMTTLILAPFQIAVCLYFIYEQIHSLMFIGLAYSILTIPLMGIVVGIVFRIRSMKINLTDRRVKLINEMFNGIRIIQYYAWEEAFVKMLQELRDQEVNALMKMALLFQSVGTILLMCAPQIQILLIFITMVSQGRQLDAAKAFTLIALFGIMLVPFTSLPVGLQQFNQSKVAMNRVFAFLGEEEMIPYVTYKETVHSASTSSALGKTDATTEGSNDIDDDVNEVEKYILNIKDKYHNKVEKAVKEEENAETVIEFKGFSASWTVATPSTTVPLEKANSGGSFSSAKSAGYNAVTNEDKHHDADIGGEEVTDIESPNKESMMVNNNKSTFTSGVASGEERESMISNRALNTLQHIDLKIQKGQLVAIIGAVGSGKSSLLSAILGELYKRQGELILSSKKNLQDETVPLSIAYCDQRAWIVNATLKENILFGKSYDLDKFEDVIYAACMEDDVDVLTGGVDTEIGERGINLSGGQKARVGLARAVYNDADIYLLDDPLSAVDAHVGRHIFNECIKGTLHGKTRLLVTHHLHILPQCDMIVILENDGSLKAVGSYEEIMASGIEVERYIQVEEDNQDAIDEAIDAMESKGTGGANGKGRGIGLGLHAQSFFLKQPPLQLKGGLSTSHAKSHSHSNSTEHGGESNQHNSYVEEDDIIEQQPEEEYYANLMSKEDKQEGNISWSVVWTYIKIGGPVLFFLSIFCQVLSQVFLLNSNFWLADWGEETSIDNLYYRQDMTESRALYWYRGYAGLVMGGFVSFIATRLIFTYHRGFATRSFHEKLLQSMVYMPISFFDITPIGRILNRFSQDIAIVDEDLPMQVIQVITSGITTLGYFAGIAGATKGTLLILAVPLLCLYVQFQHFFRQSNMAIARLEATSRSPIYADFAQTLSGTNTIRAYRQEERFITRLEMYANKNTVPGVMQQIAGQWLSIRLDLLGALIMFFMGALTVSLKDNDFIPAKYLGLGLAYSIQLTAMMKVLVRTLASVEAQFNAVERIQQYIDLPDDVKSLSSKRSHEETTSANDTKNNKTMNQSSKASLTSEYMMTSMDESDTIVHNEDIVVDGGGDIEMNMIPTNTTTTIKEPPSNWPQHGKITFEHVSMRYREGPLVLKDVSFEVNMNDKIGIAGRTGCGKSSLMVALFRVEELCGGRILIDDIDIATVPLKTLRSKLCIIPQEPVMFSSTVRFNLDPFHEFTDQQIWEVLQSVNMFEHIQSLSNQLQEIVSEGGDNFSTGQRQLICIARAILRKPKVLVMDEATASIDRETDAFIQTMIRTKFADCTVLTIAHRLHTIIDSTKVLVMDKGFAKEYDAPQMLLGHENGLFKALWERHVKEGGELTPIGMGSPSK